MPPKHKNTERHAEASSDTSRIPQGTMRISHDVTIIPALASELPFDVLFQIFEEYLLNETPAYPVETLLLVCKSWAQAALEDARLWSNFAIGLKDLAFWSSSITRRLGRCPQTALLDIRINLMGFGAGNRRHEAVALFESYHETVLLGLTGSHGETARRWRRLVMRDDYSGSRDRDFYESRIAKFLCFPMPNLQELYLRGLQSSLHIFPSTPRLNVFSAYDVVIPSFPDLSSASDVSICMDGNFQAALENAVNIVTLRLFPGGTYGYYLSAAYPYLKSLHLIRGLRWQALEGFSAPALRELTLHFEQGGEFSTVVACEGIPLRMIQEVSLQTMDGAKDHDLEFYRDKLLSFLRATTQIEVLNSIGYVSDSLIVHLLESEPLYSGHTILLKTSKCVMEVQSGKDRLSSIRELRRQYKGLPEGTWDEIHERLEDWIS